MSRNRNKTPDSRASADEAIAELANRPNNTLRSLIAAGAPPAGALAEQLEAGAAAIAATGLGDPDPPRGDTRAAEASPTEPEELDRVAIHASRIAQAAVMAIAIKVRELRLRFDVPITASNIVARSKDGVTTEIQFEPWQRHHRVREIDEETGRVRSEYCVPESWCLYVPLEIER